MASIGGTSIFSGEDVPEDYGKWLIHGPQGSGKTTLASTIAEAGKTLFIDTLGEKGVRSFRGAAYAKNIEIVRPESVKHLDDIFWELNEGKHDYTGAVLDSVTGIQKMTMRFLLGHDESAVREIKQGTAPADIRTWGQSLDVMTDLATFWFGLADGQREHPMHIAMTAQTKMVEDEATGITRRTPDVQKGALSILLASPDYILYTDVEENMDAIGDDTQSPTTHIVRFGSDPDYRIKARIPYNLRGKIPGILGRKSQTSLFRLSQILGIGGVPAPAAKKAAAPSA